MCDRGPILIVAAMGDDLLEHHAEEGAAGRFLAMGVEYVGTQRSVQRCGGQPAVRGSATCVGE